MALSHAEKQDPTSPDSLALLQDLLQILILFLFLIHIIEKEVT